MRAKQVTALMMAATLAVTGNGVTAFAEPVANVEAGDAATEALNVETTEEVETAAEVEVTEDSEDVTKSAQQDASSDVTVETKTSATTVKAGATVTVTTTVKGDKLTNGTLTVKSYELIATKSAVDTTIATSADGTFVFAPEKDTTYKVKAVFTHASEKNEYYAEKALDAFTIEAASIATNRLHVPEVTTISNKDGAALNTTAAPEVTAALETANKLDEAYGKWTVKDEAVTTATKEIVFTFTATDGVYTIDNSDTAAVETDKTYEKTVSVKVVQLATGVSIEDENGPISTTVEMATTDKKALTAKVAAGSGSDTVSNAKVTWTSSDSSKVKVTATGDNEAVITAVSKTEAGKEVTITATTTDGTQKVGEIKVAVKEGINADSISFDSKLPEITYEGAGDLEDYYKDYVAALNKKTTIGTYSIKDTSETIDSVGGVDKTSTVASLKTNTENSQTIKNGLTIVFTLSDDAGLTPVDGKTKWDTKTVEKTYDVVINRAVINRDASAVTGKLESSYAAGVKLSEILAGKNDTEFDIEIQKKVDGAWQTISDDTPNIGTLANYQVKYSLKDSAKNVYTLSGADANGYKYVSLAVSVVDPNYTTDTKVTLKANVNVAKAPLSVTAKDVTIEQGQEAALDGTVKGLVGKDTAKVTYAVLGTDGKAVQSTKNLAVGTYKIRATVEDQKNYDVTSVVDGTLTVNAVAATGVIVNTTALKINVGESRQVSATVAPANAADKNVTWSSDNTAVAKVTSDGVVYAIAEGTANVTAKTANGKTATIAVTVSTVKADSVKLSASKVTLTSIGASKTVKATVNPTNTTDKTVTWKSSNKKVATVDKNGKIVAKGNGKATITVKTANGKKATVKVTVKQATKKVVLKVGKKVVTGKTYTLKEGKKATVKATVTDAKGKKVTSGNQKIKWTTSNKKVATISKSGKITAKKAGTVKITAKTADGKKVTFKVKVK